VGRGRCLLRVSSSQVDAVVNRALTAAIALSWALVACFALVGIVTTYVAIWQQSEQWGWTAFVSVVLAAFGGVFAAFLTMEVRASDD
jgi:uncharacterized membrane protein HdeD (DUF308 family)